MLKMENVLDSKSNYLKLQICPRAVLKAVLGETFHIWFALKLETQKGSRCKART